MLDKSKYPHLWDPIPDLDPKQQVIVDLTLGTREPQNAEEERLLEDINAAKARGWTIELPFD